MTSIFILVSKQNKTTGHGESCDYLDLAMTGMYNTGPSHPAFTSKEKADSYIATLPEYQALGLTPYEVTIKE